MNKYAIQTHLASVLEPYQSSFKDTSYDKENKEHLCSDAQTNPVYDFDQYARTLPADKHPASPDAIYLGKKTLYFVEFKNSSPSTINNPQMQKKFKDGTNILTDLLKTFAPKDVRYVFCVVYKQQKAQYFNPAHIESQTVKFGLAEINRELGNFYDETITEDVDFYKKAYSSALSCT